MSLPRPSRPPARLCLLVPAAVRLLLALVVTAAVAPAAVAADSGFHGSHVEMVITISEDDALDLAVTFATEGRSAEQVEERCDVSALDVEDDVTGTFTTEVGTLDGMPACRLRVAGMVLSDMSTLFSEDAVVRHTEDAYEVVLDNDFFAPFDAARLTIAFPGKVESASGSNEVTGSSVTWSDAASESRIRAVGADSSGMPWLWVLAALVVAGTVVFLLVVRRRQAVAARKALSGYRSPVPGGPTTSEQPRVPVPPQDSYAARPGHASQPGAPDVAGQGQASTVARPGSQDAPGQAPEVPRRGRQSDLEPTQRVDPSDPPQEPGEQR